MNLPTEAYEAQAERWPRSGRHILAHYDEASIVVYQAYRPSIAAFAVAEGRLGGPEFSFARMSWIKPNYLWMMFRSRWGTKEGQESTLGLRISREFFERILEQAVPSSYDSRLFADHESWKSAGDQSDVRLQWDPDHSPSGANLERRAIQLGLRGKTLRAFATSELLEVIDLTEFVAAQRGNVAGAFARLRTPVERVYKPRSATARLRAQIDDSGDR